VGLSPHVRSSIGAVPLTRAGAAVGVITLRGIEARLFSDKQIALLETFANQAIIVLPVGCP
jgi:hypothetical protein